jgi:hypothetical protein
MGPFFLRGSLRACPNAPISSAPTQLKFSVDPEHNARSGAAAMAWGKGMWRAMLG